MSTVANKALDILQSGRYKLCRLSPFFGFASWQLQFAEEPDIPGLATDGQKLFYNPLSVVNPEKLDDWDQRIGLAYEVAPARVAHETGHSMLGHCRDWSATFPNQPKVNAAQDYAINLMLKDAGFKIPSWYLCDERFRGMTWQEIYPLLPDDADCTCQCKVRPQPDGNGGKDDDGRKINNWERILVEAVRFAQSQSHGSVPAGFEDLVEKITHPEVDWRAVVARFASRLRRGGFSFMRPNKRYLRQRLVMPSTYSWKANLVVFLDTSGSMWGVLNRIWGELYGVLKAVNAPVLCVQVDAEIQNTFELKRPDDVRRLRKKGGGGTSFVPAFDWLEKSGRSFDAALFFTDAYGTYPQKPPRIRTLWCVTDLPKLQPDYRPPFGTCVNVPLKES